jgi:hypothetical protein
LSVFQLFDPFFGDFGGEKKPAKFSQMLCFWAAPKVLAKKRFFRNRNTLVISGHFFDRTPLFSQMPILAQIENHLRTF